MRISAGVVSIVLLVACGRDDGDGLPDARMPTEYQRLYTRLLDCPSRADPATGTPAPPWCESACEPIRGTSLPGMTCYAVNPPTMRAYKCPGVIDIDGQHGCCAGLDSGVAFYACQ